MEALAFLDRYLQPQRPMAAMLGALSLPALAAVWNFGWHAAALVALCMFTCWAVEYAFTRKEGKPASLAALVTGALLALTLPPGFPWWMAALGSAFCLLFGKMAFGGFGRNVFNPAILGRCALYVGFPVAMTGAWVAPFTAERDGMAAGFVRWAPLESARCRTVESSVAAPDIVGGATALTTVKRLNGVAREARAPGAPPPDFDPGAAFASIPVWRLVAGNHNGCLGETSAVAILLGLAWLIRAKAVLLPLFLSPLLGVLLGKGLLHLAGVEVLPFGQGLLVALFGGGTLFACAFMVTEPVTAPTDQAARWIYGLWIGLLATLIRSLSIWNAGFMFSILIGNACVPLIETAVAAARARFGGGSES